MSTVDSNYIEEGDTSSVTIVNTIYTDIETASEDIDDENTRTEWVSLKHMTDNVVLIASEPDFPNPVSLTSTTYVAITSDVVAYTLEQGDVLRLHANIGTEENGVGDSTVDDYWFAFFWTRDDGGGPVTEQIGPDHCYSLCSTDEAGGHQQYNYQRHGFSYVYIHTSVTPRDITALEVHGKVENATNTVSIERGDCVYLHIRGG